MTQNEKQIYSDGFYITALLFKNKWFIILLTLISTIGISIYAFYMPLWYKSTVNVVPPQNPNGSDSPISGISSTLKDFGLTKLGGSGGGESYSFMVILQSRTLMDSIIKKYELAKEYDMQNSNMTLIREAFLDNYLIVNDKLGNYTISIISKDKNKAADMANEIVVLANNIGQKMAQDEAIFNLTYIEDRFKRANEALIQISDSLQKFSKKNQIFAPEEQAKAASQFVSELKTKEIQYQMAYDLAKNKYGENDPLTTSQLQLLNDTKNRLDELNNKPGYIGNFSLNDASQVSIQYLKLYTEYETNSKIRAFLVPSLEKARLDIAKNTKSLFVLDKAIPADKKYSPKRSLIILGGFFGSFIISVMFVFIYNALKSFNQKYKQFISVTK